MNGDFTFTLDKEEYSRLMRAISQLEYADQGPVIAKSLKEGGSLIITEGKSNFLRLNESRKGKLIKSFATLTNKKKREAKVGFKRPGGAAAHLIDRGTDDRWTKSGKYTGSVSAKRPNTGTRFWSDAVESKGDEALEKIIDAVYENIEKIIDRN